ncbi:MAG TPA: hypothetical protein VF988_06010, partial [Verrucomicrobiae bacterium]
MAELKQLGKVPDSVLARRLRCPIKEVVAERERRGIALPTGPRRWTAREIRLLGQMNDHELARRLRRPKQHVHRQRKQLKIPPFKPRPRFRVWKPAEYRILGTVTDAEAAQILGRTKASVQLARVRSGIPPFNHRPSWKPEEIALLGSASDEEVARQLGRSVLAVRTARQQHTEVRFPTGLPAQVLDTSKEEVKATLRECTIPEAAARLGCPALAVVRARKELGIHGKHGNWKPEEDALLGTMPDKDVAAR